MLLKKQINHLTVSLFSILVSVTLVAGCAPVRHPEPTNQKQKDDKGVTAELCTNVFDEYRAGEIADDDLLFLYKPESLALKQSNGIYLRELDREMCLYLKFLDLEPHWKYTLRYKIYDPENKLYSSEEYNFIPDSQVWHAWNTQEITPKDHKQLSNGSWVIKVTMDDKPIASKVFVIHSNQENNVLAQKQFEERLQVQMVREIIIDKFSKNGALYFCNNDCYIGCYNISRSTCLEELNPIVISCLELAEVQMDLSGNTETSFGALWAVCVQVEHSTMHAEISLEKASKCVGHCPTDVHEAEKILMQE